MLSLMKESQFTGNFPQFRNVSQAVHVCVIYNHRGGGGRSRIELKASLGYIASSRAAGPLQRDPVFKKGNRRSRGWHYYYCNYCCWCHCYYHDNPIWELWQWKKGSHWTTTNNTVTPGRIQVSGSRAWVLRDPPKTLHCTSGNLEESYYG